MFEHLDDHNLRHGGTGSQLADVRTRARVLRRERRRNKIAFGSVTLAATAVVSGSAVAGSLTGSGSANGQAGGGGTATKPPAAAGSSTGTNPGPEAPVDRHLDPSADAAKAAKLAGQDLKATDNADAPPPHEPCSAALPALAGVAAPPGYSTVDTPTPDWARYAGAGDASVQVKVTCSPVPADESTSNAQRTVSGIRIAGHAALLWQSTKDAGVEWATGAGAIYIQASGVVGTRLSDDQLEAFAATLPTG